MGFQCFIFGWNANLFRDFEDVCFFCTIALRHSLTAAGAGPTKTGGEGQQQQQKAL